MSVSPKSLVTRTVFVLVLVAFAAAARAEEPPVGSVRELAAVSISVAAGGSDRETKRSVYTPPPGWYVRGHKVAVANRTGTVSYAVGSVPAGWRWSLDERAAMTARAAATAAATLPNGLAAGGQVAGSREGTVSGGLAAASSHHALVVEVTAVGGGLWRGGAGADVTVYAEIVYLGREPVAVAGR